MPADVLRERLPGDALNDNREQKVVGVGVLVLGSAREVEPPLPYYGRERLLVGGCLFESVAGQIEQVGVVAQTARVPRQFVQRERRAVVRQLRDVLVNVVVQREFVLLRQQQDCDRGELLRHGADVEQRGGR